MTLNRRELTGYFLTFGLAVPTVGTMAIGPSGVAAPGIAANAPGRTVKLHDGTVVPALGQGSARLGQGRHPATVEEDALREGISLGDSDRYGGDLWKRRGGEVDRPRHCGSA